MKKGCPKEFFVEDNNLTEVWLGLRYQIFELLQLKLESLADDGKLELRRGQLDTYCLDTNKGLLAYLKDLNIVVATLSPVARTDLTLGNMQDYLTKADLNELLDSTRQYISNARQEASNSAAQVSEVVLNQFTPEELKQLGQEILKKLIPGQ